MLGGVLEEPPPSLALPARDEFAWPAVALPAAPAVSAKSRSGVPEHADANMAPDAKITASPTQLTRPRADCMGRCLA